MASSSPPPTSPASSKSSTSKPELLSGDFAPTPPYCFVKFPVTDKLHLVSGATTQLSSTGTLPARPRFATF
ncbi:hypothetical protein M0R45_031099 [Rubus argutus]|uniref:Uncharacterized protein n=1 Tax=Rubus argutus TaxID=59490 RepID=A0AAW1WCX1_RUBAR